MIPFKIRICFFMQWFLQEKYEHLDKKKISKKFPHVENNSGFP